MDALFILFAVLFVLSLIPLAFLGVRAYRRYRGARVIVCPETCRPAAVEPESSTPQPCPVSAWPGGAACRCCP